MKERSVVETRISELTDINCLWRNLPNGEMEIVNSDEQIASAAKAWKMTPEAVEAIRDAFNYLTEQIVELLTEDLKDLWDATH